MDNTMIQQLIDQLSKDYIKEIDNSIDALLCMGGCVERKDKLQMQIELAENGYDLVRYEFKNQPYKTFVMLSTINGEFVKGYLIQVNQNTYEIKRELIKSKYKYKQLIQQIK